MRYSFSLENVDYNHILSVVIREELGRCLCSARKRKGQMLKDIPGLTVSTVSGVERNISHHSWRGLKKIVNRYGYDARIGITFNVDVSLYERTQKQTKV